eukprot:GAHX01001866.1.p1 GENE.GAHX01001866.1~~GAHX01001866.1.p1  ORF type:complete len:287 (+),score=52.75 GAHX01001866.1:41-862(+)
MTFTHSPDCLVPQNFLSIGETSSITTTIQSKTRIDGRELLQTRESKILQFSSTDQNISFVYCLGQTSIHCICTPKLIFLEKTSPHFFDIKITTCNASIMTPIISSLVTTTSNIELENIFKEELESTKELTKYLTKAGGLAWKLSLNFTLLTYEGNLVAALSNSVKELISWLKFPVMKIKLTPNKALKDYKVAYDEFEQINKPVSDSLFSVVVLKDINGTLVRDPNVEEEIVGGNSYVGFVKKNTIAKVMEWENNELKKCNKKEVLKKFKEIYK